MDVKVYGDEVQLLPGGGLGPGFRAMWRYCQLIAATDDFVVHDPDYGEIVDLELSEDDAAVIYDWC